MGKKPCNCGNKNNFDHIKKFTVSPTNKIPIKNAEGNHSSIQPSTEDIKVFSEKILNDEPPKIGILSMVQSYAMAMASRGLSDKKTDKPTKQLRVLSCFGNKNTGEELSPCPHLKPSSTEGKFYCGACGCGDRKQTWLNGNDSEYTKLDYPKVNCPLKMPGFTNYEPSSPNEAKDPNSRKNYIENINFDSLQNVNITTPEMPKEISELFDKIIEAQKNKNQP